MGFIKAVWYLKEHGADVKPSSVFSSGGRMYSFEDVEDSAPPMLLSPKAIKDMALFLHSGTIR
jgi:hypothetical protein